MSLTRGEIAGRILRLVNKTASYPGFYTPAKIDDAIEEALDFIAVDMFIAGEGWQDKIKYLAASAGQVTIPLTADIAMIKEVRFLYGGEYLPMTYDDMSRQSQLDTSQGTAYGYTGRYRVVDNQLYFNPPLSEGGEKYIQLEYTTFPKRMSDDNDVVEAHFFKPFLHWVVYWACSRLVSGVGKADPDWATQEGAWYTKIKMVIEKRNMQTTVMREFQG